MTEIAFASGFGSIRRFNETFLTLFGRPPQAHCAVCGGPDVTAADQGEFSLSAALQATVRLAGNVLRFLEQRAIPGVERVAAGSYSRTHRAGWGAGSDHRPSLVEGNALRASIRISKLADTTQHHRSPAAPV